MPQFKVALLQMKADGNNQAANLAKGEDFCRRAAAQGADLALFPEMWNVGYTSTLPAGEDFDVLRHPARWPEEIQRKAAALRLEEVWQGLAVARDGGFVAHFQALAKELDMAIAITYLEQWDGAPRNSVSIIDRRGQMLLTYAKVHTCDFAADEAALTPGDEFPVCQLETAGGPLQVGAMICYDREFLESARILMLKGAEIILTPNACEMEPHRLGQLRARADENMLGVAMANYARPRWGHSVAYDPVIYDKQGARDTLVIEAGESEGIYLAIFEMDQIRDYRRREVWGNAFRKPRRYGPLTAPGIEEPFTRVTAAGDPYDPSKR